MHLHLAHLRTLFLSKVKFATISANAAPVAAVNAAIAPPPGVGSFEAVAATKSFTVTRQ